MPVCACVVNTWENTPAGILLLRKKIKNSHSKYNKSLFGVKSEKAFSFLLKSKNPNKYWNEAQNV